ncbi:dioxygenase family protein [Shinella sumterensis]|uniref:dioxygenase family protein n=1 Tax=Shinella sumterensis TaxID=1967501 RepID=UPI003F843216
MTLDFTYQASAARIVFGNGASGDVGKWVEALDCRRALVLSTPHQAADAEALSKRLGPLSVGIFTTDGQGCFRYKTVRPGGYAVPSDGPVGQMLGGLGFAMRRPAHLHFLIKAAGFETISTHVYDGSDPHLGQDALFGVKDELIGEFKPTGKGDASTLDFTFTMVRAKKGRGTP